MAKARKRKEAATEPEVEQHEESWLAPPETEILEGYQAPPEPYDELLFHGPDIELPPGHRDWADDYADQVIPQRKGFLTDFVFFSRGVMTPTIACIWTALFVLSSAVKREAWLKWVPNDLYTNQYIIIIGPAGIMKKTTAVTGFGLPLLQKYRSYLNDRNVYEMKRVSIVKDKTTPEALLTEMLPSSKPDTSYYLRNKDNSLMLGPDGKAIPVRKTSEVALVVSELTTLLSNSSYAQSMTQILLDIYDCHSTWEWRTQNRGVQKLKWLHTTMLAGTTVMGFRDSIPAAAKGDGFLSRSVLVYAPQSKRVYPRPFIPFGAPSQDEMAKRLAWVVGKAQGEYELSEEAQATFDLWYATYYDRMTSFPEFAGAISRMDVNVLKTALLLHIQRYDSVGNTIDEEDLLDAIKLVETTYESIPFLLGQLEEDVILRNVEKVSEYLEKRGKQKRAHLLSVMHLRSDVLSMVLSELLCRGLIVVEHDGKRGLSVLGRVDEWYVWVGGEHDRAAETRRLWDAKSFTNDRTLRFSKESIKGSRSKPHSHKTLADGKPGGVKRKKPKGTQHRASRKRKEED